MASSASEPQPAAGDIPASRISVIVCSKDRRALLERAVATIRACDELGAAAEIVVVEETDEPQPIPGTRYVQLTDRGRGFGHTRNVGVSSASGDILVFTDDDCEAHPGWLRNLVRPFAEGDGIVGVAGAVRVRDCGAVGHAENILGFPGGGIRYEHASGGRPMRTEFLSTCNCAYRREVVEGAGGFPEDAPFSGEDSLLAERVQDFGECVYVPDARVYHLARDSFAGIFHWFVRRGGSETLMITEGQHAGGHIASLLRSSWTLRLLLLAGALYLWPILWPFLPLLVLGYYGAMLYRYRFALSYPGYRGAWAIVPLVKLTMDFGMEVGRFKSWLHHVRR
jgi:GT2 family glycosyltransferase